MVICNVRASLAPGPSSAGWWQGNARVTGTVLTLPYLHCICRTCQVDPAQLYDAPTVKLEANPKVRGRGMGSTAGGFIQGGPEWARGVEAPCGGGGRDVFPYFKITELTT